MDILHRGIESQTLGVITVAQGEVGASAVIAINELVQRVLDVGGDGLMPLIFGTLVGAPA